ncbi:hypothetical protein LXL04_019825 [Taraxacum kok-saghyz]
MVAIWSFLVPVLFLDADEQSVEKPKGPLRHSGLNYSQLNNNRDIGNLLVHQMKEKQKCGQCDIMRIPKQINKITRLAVISKIYYWSPGFPKKPFAE